MEYKDEMHMKADTENIPETQEAPQKQAATESEQDVKERVPIGRRSDKARYHGHVSGEDRRFMEDIDLRYGLGLTRQHSKK